MSHRASKWIKESKLHFQAYLSTYAPLLLISYLETQVSKTCRVWRRVTVGWWSWCRGGRDARFQDLQGLTLCGCGAVVLMRRRKLPCCSEGIFFPEPSPKMPLIDHNTGIPDGLKLITAALFDLNKTHVVGTTPANALAVSLSLAVTVLIEGTDISFAANRYW